MVAAPVASSPLPRCAPRSGHADMPEASGQL